MVRLASPQIFLRTHRKSLFVERNNETHRYSRFDSMLCLDGLEPGAIGREAPRQISRSTIATSEYA
jgi:hypothetical protein